jgi:hypothetical protein
MTFVSSMNPAKEGKNVIRPLSRWRERAGVRVGIRRDFPLTAALRHPVLPYLCKAERDLILSPRGEEI